MAVLLWLIICLCCLQGLQALQRFEKQPSYTEVNPGQDALLTCKVLNRRGSCSWQKDNKPVGIYPKKYEWAAGDNAGARSASGGGGGDCSLWVRAATLEFDDGQWECQVTASDFTTQDALTSNPVRLVVRVAPQRPRIEYNATHVLPGHNISVKTGERATIKCVSHYGNPPSRLKWFLGQRELVPVSPQSNNTEPDNPRTWSATSVVEVNADRALHGHMLRCVALHESYPARSQDIEARLDVRYAPSIRLVGAPTGDLEEGRDALVMRCVADANPPASVVWRRAGRSDIASLEESLQLRPVGRRDAGMYTCQAQNAVGASESLSVQLDVKYPPRILSVGPDRLTTAPLFSPAAFECVAEGNPPPSYQWLQRLQGTPDTILERGRDARLVIDNVTYDHQGEYVCKVSNVIGGSQRAVQSEPIAVQVVGAPHVLRHGLSSTHEVWAKRGESASLSLVVCADPRPRHVAWEWGSLRLEAGAGIGRYHVDEMIQDSREDCYKSTLHVNGVDSADSRPYYLVAENERGADRRAVTLRVDEPLAMSVLLGVAGGCLAGLVLLVCLCVWAMRSEKCCFRKRRDLKAGELDSEKPAISDKTRLDTSGLPISADAIYTTPAGYAGATRGANHHLNHHNTYHGGSGRHNAPHSPEAMKSRSTLNTFYTPNYIDANKSTMPNSYDLFYPSDRYYATLVNSSTPIDYRQFRQRPRTPASGSFATDGSSSGDMSPARGRLIIDDNVTYRKKSELFDTLGIPDCANNIRPKYESRSESKPTKSTVGNVIDAFESMSRQSYDNINRNGANLCNTVQKNKYSSSANASKYCVRARPKPIHAFGNDLDNTFPIAKILNERTDVKDNLN